MNTDEVDDAPDELHDEDDDVITDDDEDNLSCEINTNTHADHYRLFKAKVAHDAVLGKIDASLAKKPLTATEAPYLDIKYLIAKLDDVAETIDLVVSTILAEHIKDPVLGTVRLWIRKRNSSEPEALKFNNRKDYFDIAKKFDRLLMEEAGLLLCYNEPTDKIDDEDLRICLTLSLSLACFRLGQYNGGGIHMGASKIYNNAKRF